jgi:hypothetical protein
MGLIVARMLVVARMLGAEGIEGIYRTSPFRKSRNLKDSDYRYAGITDIQGEARAYASRH